MRDAVESVEVEGALPPRGEIVARLVERHREFLAFLEPRVRSRAVAEEILQAAFVRSLEKADAIRDAESAAAWFYRLLRNALVDHYRRSAAEGRALEREALLAEPAGVDSELRGAICACIAGLLPTLKPEYAEMLRIVDLEERPLAEAAEALGITTNNAAVRAHRARQALKLQLERTCATCATHGCLDCRCGNPSPSAAPQL